jgi:hypothetical protein
MIPGMIRLLIAATFSYITDLLVCVCVCVFVGGGGQTVRGGMYLYLNFREATRPSSTVSDVMPALAENRWKAEVQRLFL